MQFYVCPVLEGHSFSTAKWFTSNCSALWHDTLPACTDASDLLVYASVNYHDIKGFDASVNSQYMHVADLTPPLGEDGLDHKNVRGNKDK